MAVARRGCGTRVAGGTYIESGLSPDGKPLEFFMFDPPVPDSSRWKEPEEGVATVDLAGLGVTAVGVQVVEYQGMAHVFDWVGEMHYPNVLDFLEEVRALGLSRRAELNASDYAKLKPGSRIYLIHPRGWIRDYQGYLDAIEADPHVDFTCPKKQELHQGSQAQLNGLHCSGLWWHDVRDGQPTLPDQPESREVTRQLPSLEYTAWTQPEGFPGRYVPALVAWLPITGLAVVKDPEGGKHKGALERVRNTGLPVDLVEE